jgi:hypothetical protein
MLHNTYLVLGLHRTDARTYDLGAMREFAKAASKLQAGTRPDEGRVPVLLSY